MLFSVMLGWLPAVGMESVGAGLTGMSYLMDVARHLVLPTVSLGCFFMAIYVRLTRASMLEVMGMDFVKTARAKGVPAGQVIRRHVLRNALLPVRSEEHTSELQSLMRISYAVFCLKKK